MGGYVVYKYCDNIYKATIHKNRNAAKFKKMYENLQKIEFDYLIGGNHIIKLYTNNSDDWDHDNNDMEIYIPVESKDNDENKIERINEVNSSIKTFAETIAKKICPNIQSADVQIDTVSACFDINTIYIKTFRLVDYNIMLTVVIIDKLKMTNSLLDTVKIVSDCDIFLRVCKNGKRHWSPLSFWRKFLFKINVLTNIRNQTKRMEYRKRGYYVL